MKIQNLFFFISFSLIFSFFFLEKYLQNAGERKFYHFISSTFIFILKQIMSNRIKVNNKLYLTIVLELDMYLEGKGLCCHQQASHVWDQTNVVQVFRQEGGINFALFFLFFLRNVTIPLSFISKKGQQLKLVYSRNKFRYVFKHCSR